MTESEQYCLLMLLRKVKRDQSNLHIKFKSGGQMVVLGKEGLFRQDGCNLKSLVQATPANTVVRKIAKKSPVIDGVKKRGRELRELQWMLAYEMSGGKLLFDAKDTHVFKIDRWPNFTRLPHSDSCLRMAAFLGKRATSVALVSKILEIPIEQVRRFYVASREAGYTVALNEKAEVTEVGAKWINRALISSLLMKLKRVPSDVA
ncbi:hypothetical protein [Marinobacter sp. ANT_B65]|uniref:hypothetical protein n=1 Tax=Marinobacter sp. ANT_B65 TaxID=2039467 RepID=UPI000BBF2939|nr:hypothetical protein [Marinobacter sp. ANT_B65]PCM45289.1 hypothetical protein CPA50_04580 [Marinobacter sp. ANT_B65]